MTQSPQQNHNREFKKILPFILIIVSLFGLLHYFIFQITTRSVSSSNLIQIWGLVLILGVISIPVGFYISFKKSLKFYFLVWIGYIWMGIFNFLLFFSLLEFIMSLFLQHEYSYWVLPASLIITFWSLYKGLKDPKINHHVIENTQLKDLRLVQISDLHIGMLHLNENWLSRIVNRIKDLNPDIIVITGDLVEGEYNENHHKLNSLKELRPAMKKYYITGNHEYIHGAGPWEAKLKEIGFTVLHNRNEIFEYNNSKILIAGVPDRMIGRFIKGQTSEPDKALFTDQKSDYKILLAHQPSSVFDLKKEKCDLILSGHTHGGQIFPFHLLVKLAHPVLSGFRTVNGVKVFAHQGTGLWGPPMRWFSESEIVLLHWM